MFFLEILIFTISIVIVSLSISGYGSLTSLNLKKNFFLDFFLGLIIISLIITLVHFFFKISVQISFLIFLLGLLFFFYKKKFNFLKSLKKKNFFFLIIIFFFIPIFISQKYHEDFGYYHLPYALNFIEDKIIFGFANINPTYVYNSIWLNLFSIFFLNDKNFDFLTLPSFLLFLNFIFFCLYQVISKSKKQASDYFLLITLFYFILKFTRISEFGVDLPATIFSILAIYNFLKFSEVSLIDEKKDYFFLILIFSIFSILIKLSTIPILFLPVFLYIKYFKNLKLVIFRFRFFLIYILSITFFIQQFIYTGCLLFPTNLTCLNVSWFSESNINLSNQLKLTNKSYYGLAKDIFTPEEYLKNFNWFIFWFKRSFVEISEHLLTITLPVILFLFFQKKKANGEFFLDDKIGLYLFLIIGFLFWLNFSPVYRFAVHLFLTLIFVLLINLLMSKDFSKKFFLIFLTTFIFFSFSKNILRLNRVENIFLGVQKINNQYILNDKNTNPFVKIYKPDVNKNSKNGWQGRLCWDIPFICSTNMLNIQKQNGYFIINKLTN